MATDKGELVKGVYSAVKVTDRVYWVGAIDWHIRDMHGYLTKSGTTYNAFLVLADKVTLIDTVKAPFKDEMLSRIASQVDPGNIDYVVSNHAEMDHTGCLIDVIKTVEPEKVFASAMGIKALEDHFHAGYDIVEAKNGGSIDLGNMTIKCYETRMLHWPDSMFSYLVEENLLFSQDAFGMHLATSERFDDELDEFVLEHEAAKYYANIILPFSNLVLKLFDKLGDLGLEPAVIAPDHGPIWRKRIDWILGLYKRWAGRELKNKAVIVYDTMWGSTDKMARAIEEGLIAKGSVAKVMKLRACHRSDIATELLDAGALVVGSPTINNNMFPTVADALYYIRGLKPSRLVGAAFGSYGWSGESLKQVEEMLEAMKVELVSEGLKAKYVPDEEVLTRCRAMGERIAERLSKLPRPKHASL